MIILGIICQFLSIINGTTIIKGKPSSARYPVVSFKQKENMPVAYVRYGSKPSDYWRLEVDTPFYWIDRGVHVIVLNNEAVLNGYTYTGHQLWSNYSTFATDITMIPVNGHLVFGDDDEFHAVTRQEIERMVKSTRGPLNKKYIVYFSNKELTYRIAPDSEIGVIDTRNGKIWWNKNTVVGGWPIAASSNYLISLCPAFELKNAGSLAHHHELPVWIEVRSIRNGQLIARKLVSDLPGVPKKITCNPRKITLEFDNISGGYSGWILRWSHPPLKRMKIMIRGGFRASENWSFKSCYPKMP